MRSIKEILANEKFQADKKNDFAFEGLVLIGFLHLYRPVCGWKQNPNRGENNG